MEKFFPKVLHSQKLPESQENLLQPDKAIKSNKEDDIGHLKGSLENVVKLFNTVREIDNLKTGIQELVFSQHLPKYPYKCVEITKSMVEEFKKGTKLVFRGSHDDLAVLCTETKTYDIKEVETSNSLLITPGVKDSSFFINDGDRTLEETEVVIVTHNYYELKEIECVSIFRLRELLHEAELHWEWNTNDKPDKRYTWNDLIDQIPMSETQLRNHINSMPIIEHQGFFRWLSSEFRDRLIEEIIILIDDDDKSGVSIEKISFDSLRYHLPKNVPDSMIYWFLKSLCKEIENTKVFKIIESQLVKSKASQILRIVNNMEVSLFERQLCQALPTGIEIKPAYFEDITIVTNNFKGRTISYLNVEDLPENPRERLKVLFERKESWKMEEIQYFLVDICANQKAMSSLLVAHCRASKNEKGEKIFSRLRPV